MNNEETIGIDYQQEYYKLFDEMSKNLEYQKEQYEKQINKLEKDLKFYKEIIKSILNIRD